MNDRNCSYEQRFVCQEPKSRDISEVEFCQGQTLFIEYTPVDYIFLSEDGHSLVVDLQDYNADDSSLAGKFQVEIYKTDEAGNGEIHTVEIIVESEEEPMFEPINATEEPWGVTLSPTANSYCHLWEIKTTMH